MDKSIKFTMLCIGVVGRNNRGFSRVYGVIFVQIFTGFYCLFIASLSSKKGIKSPVMKHQKRNKIGMLECEKMYKNVWVNIYKMYKKKPCFQSFFRSKNKVNVDFVTCFFRLR